ncbi:unnamed protein product, partial [Rotaria magnacalcarata]
MVVKLTSQVPIFLPRFRFSPEVENIIQEQVDELLAQNLIKPSTSPYNFPVLPVKKRVPEGQPPKFRLCLDLRSLNKIAVKYNYPLPDINVTLQQMGGFAHYVKLDMANGFWQMGIHPDSEDYLSFSTAKGHFSMLRAPQGYISTPMWFQSALNNVFGELLFPMKMTVTRNVNGELITTEETRVRLQIYLDDAVLC